MEIQVFPMGGQLSKENEFGMVGIVSAAILVPGTMGFVREHDKGQQCEVGQYVCSKGCNMSCDSIGVSCMEGAGGRVFATLL